MPENPITIDFDDGTIVVKGEFAESLSHDVEELRFDPRVDRYRAPAHRYHDLIYKLIRSQIPYVDNARQYQVLSLEDLVDRVPRDYQIEALSAWRSNGRRGVVVLPTGSGKSFVAIMAIRDRPRSTLIVAPTIDLMNQWHDLLVTYFGIEVGIVGGGTYDVRELTVTTYDSAYIHLGNLGNRFGLVIFDECHHLPSPSYATAAKLALAPFRLGLTATPERPDGRHVMLDHLIGETIYRRDIHEMAGEYLANYRTETVMVDLDEEEWKIYNEARELYRGYCKSNGIMLGGANGWKRFIIETSKSDAGRKAFSAWRVQRQIALATPRKLLVLRDLLRQHSADRILIFTNDNATVYKISTEFLVPAITHQTKTKERHETLSRFNSGLYPIVVTSKVLNEGVNVPEANVAVVLSGSGTVREHVQRLGRILRKVGDKQAILYEVIARGTSEESISERRRQHDAYR
jgi:superfamily II DNA or RNA helicase